MALTIRIGTRGSPLALWQARHVAGRLRRAAPECTVELVEIQTSGDIIHDAPLAQIGGQGAFTKEIQRALQASQVDVAVHSLKDLPTFSVANLILAAVPKRGPVGDALIATKHSSFVALPTHATVATSSVRRRAQILHRRPDLNLIDIRGNVDTRLRKLVEQDIDAIILAEAGLSRLGLEKHITEVLDPSWMLPAVGQGALGIECRADDAASLSVVSRMTDAGTFACVLAERALLRGLGGGCQLPIGAATAIDGDQLALRGVVVRPNGTERMEATISGAMADAEELGQRLAEQLLAQGAGELLTES